MLWSTPVYRFRVPVSETSEFSKELIINVTKSAPSFTVVKTTMGSVWETLLASPEGKRIASILDFGAGKFRNTLYFLREGKKVTAVEFQDLAESSQDAKAILKQCEAKQNFQHLLFPNPFIQDSGKYDLVLLVNVLPVMPVFAERLLVLDLLYDKVKEGKYVLWYAQQEGSYKEIREAGKNTFADGIWMGTNKKFKTFYKYHPIDDVLEVFALYGFGLVRKIPAAGNDVLLLQKNPYNLFHGVITPQKIESAIPSDDTIQDPSHVKIKRVKSNDEKLEVDPNPPIFNLENLYANVLSGIRTGVNGAEAYHRIASQIVLRIFRGSLRNMDIKASMSERLKIIDTIYTNSKEGIFDQMANKFGIQSPYVVLEAKNYNYDVANPEFDQIAGRLTDHVAKFGILVCRKVEDQDVVIKRCQTYLKDNNKHVIVLEDKDLIDLLGMRAGSDTDSITDFVDRKFRSIRLG